MNYKLTIIKKNVKNITLKIKDSKTVILIAPKYIKEEFLKEILDKKRAWISKNLELFQTKEKYTVKDYNSGDFFHFLGISYPLEILYGSTNNLILTEDKFILTLSEENFHNNFLKEKIFSEWYRAQANFIFLPITNHYLTLLNENISILKYSFMKTRWGSCNFFKKSINLNLELLKRKPSLIEYVILHEICHLKFPNHQKKFWNHLEFYMPDWKLKRKKLKDFIL